MQYPNDIKPLTGLRFIAAFWLLLYFFWPRLGLGERPNIIASGNYGVDLFFILSGFVLAHVYGPQVQEKRYSHGAFIWARLARVYPLHILTFFAMVILWLAGRAIGATFEASAFNVAHIPFHLTMTQAWGFTNSESWNFPSWSISAEWFAYLTFPISFYLISRFKSAPLAGVLAIFAAYYIMFAIFAANNLSLNHMTWQGAEARILIAFMGGAMLWQLGQNIRLSANVARYGVYLSALWIAVASIFTASAVFIWPALMGLVFFLAETSKHPEHTLIGNKTWVYLGEISFAMYMVHLPIDIAFFQLIEKIIGTPSGILAAVLVAVSIILVTIGAAIVHQFFEKPVRDYMRKNTPKFFQNNTKASFIAAQ